MYIYDSYFIYNAVIRTCLVADGMMLPVNITDTIVVLFRWFQRMTSPFSIIAVSTEVLEGRTKSCRLNGLNEVLEGRTKSRRLNGLDWSPWRQNKIMPSQWSVCSYV